MSKKRCLFCGNWFRPARRRQHKQKSCYRAKCRRKREELARRRWRRKNRGYFEGRYPLLKRRWDYAGYLRSYRARYPEFVTTDNRMRRVRRRRARRRGRRRA